MTASNGPKVETLIAAILEKHPKHQQFLARRFADVSDAEKASNEILADQILSLAGDNMDQFVDGYEFICQIQKEEELYFRRNKSYRLTSFQDALDQIYSNTEYMGAYMRGLLVTQLLWSNHTHSISFYTNAFLGNLKSDAELLEIGPGHGLLFARAVKALPNGKVTGWDVSASSLSHTREALAALGVHGGFDLQARNLFDQQAEQFDAVVFSEVLEHLEDPQGALRAIRSLIRPGGKLFLNVPINSPAPDHIFLLRSPDETFDLVRNQGFDILETGCFPATNYSMEQALRHDLTISVSLIATPA